MSRFFALAVIALALAGCGQQHLFHARDISGLMPDLNFTLTDDNGRTVTAADYQGKDVLLFFGYTNCPDYCPATLAHLQQAIKRLPEATRKALKVLFVSVDPKRDTPAKLKQYTAYFGPEFVGLTGSMDALKDLTKRYRTTFSYGEADAKGNYEVSHGLAVYAFDRRGQVRLMILNDEPIPQLSEDLTQLAQL